MCGGVFRRRRGGPDQEDVENTTLIASERDADDADGADSENERWKVIGLARVSLRSARNANVQGHSRWYPAGNLFPELLESGLHQHHHYHRVESR